MVLMSQVLSQNEVDALLTAVSEGVPEEGEEKAGQAPGASQIKEKPKDFREYDLTSQDRIFRGKMPMLDVIHEKFCRDFRGSLSLDLGRLASLEPNGINLMKYQEFLNGLPVPTCLSVFKIDPLPGNGVIVIESSFIFTLVDIFCGGSGTSRYRVEGRDFSSIEIGIVRKVVTRALSELNNAWQPIYPASIEFIGTEINPQFVSIAHPTEVVISIESQVDVEGAVGSMQIVIPYATIEPIREKLTQHYVGDKNEIERMWKKELRGHITGSEVEVRIVMGATDLTIREVLDMKEGDVLTLDRFSDEPLDLLVEERLKMKVETGVLRGYKALKVVDSDQS